MADTNMTEIIHIPVEGATLEGALTIPAKAEGIVLFAHGSGSSRHSPRNNYVANELQEAGLGTLLIDLLSETEDLDYNRRFDIDLLVERLVAITEWLQESSATSSLKIGLFGASTGSAAALRTAGQQVNVIGAVVSRGGRVDLAEEAVPKIKAPTLFIVGERDYGVLELNEIVYAKLNCTKELEIVPHATHLFEEPGTLEHVAHASADWFTRYLTHKITAPYE